MKHHHISGNHTGTAAMNFRKKLALVSAVAFAASAGFGMAYASGLTGFANLFGDINSDGEINAVDAAKILEYSAYQGSGGAKSLYEWMNGNPDDTPEIPTDAEEDGTLTILCYAGDTIGDMVDYYDKSGHDTSKIRIITTDGVSDAEQDYASYFNSGEDVDLYFTSAGNSWRRQFLDNPNYSAPLSSIGIYEGDYTDAYSYALELGKNSKGELVAAAWESCAGGFCYNTEIASEYLGVYSPTQMQARVSDWDAFAATADELSQASGGRITMTATLDGLWQCFSSGYGEGWVNGSKLKTDAPLKFTAMAKKLVSNGNININAQQWTDEWYHLGTTEGTLGYFFATWCFGDGNTFEQCCGTRGNWAVVEGPQAWYWGGDYLCATPQCNNPGMAHKFLDFFTCNADTMEGYAKESGTMLVNNQKAMENLIASETLGNSSLGGQDYLAVLHENAKKIKLDYRNMSEYDDGIRWAFIDAFREYPNAYSSMIMDVFEKNVQEEYPFLSLE